MNSLKRKYKMTQPKLSLPAETLIKIEKITAGCYKASAGKVWAMVHKVDSFWYLEVMGSPSDNLYNTKKEAIEDFKYLLSSLR